MIIKQTFSGNTAQDCAQETYNFFNTYCLDIFDSVNLTDNVVTLTKGEAEIKISPLQSVDIVKVTLANGREGGCGGVDKYLTKAIKTSKGVMFRTSNDTSHFINKTSKTLFMINPNDGITFADLLYSTNFSNHLNMTKIVANNTAFAPIVIDDSDNNTDGIYYTPFMQYDLAFGTISTGNLNFACSGYIALKD